MAGSFLAYNADMNHNVNSDHWAKGVVMCSKESSTTRIWRAGSDPGKRVVIQCSDISVEQRIRVQEEICEIMENLLLQRVNQISSENGGGSNG